MVISAGDLRNRVELLQRTETLNALGETAIAYQPSVPPRKIWAKITPTAGSRDEIAGTAERVTITHRVTIRRSSLKDIPTDLHLRYRGQDYLLQYYYPNYRDNAYLDLFCRLEVDDHGQGY